MKETYLVDLTDLEYCKADGHLLLVRPTPSLLHQGEQDVIPVILHGERVLWTNAFSSLCHIHFIRNKHLTTQLVVAFCLYKKKTVTLNSEMLHCVFPKIDRLNRPYSRCQSLKPSLVFLNRASYGRRRNNDVTSQEREVTMMLHHNLRTDAQICGKSASQASLFVRHGRGVNRVYCFLQCPILTV